MSFFLQHRHRILLLSFIVGAMALVMLSAQHLAEQRARRSESLQLHQQLELYAQSLQQRIERYRTIAQVLALDPELRNALKQPLSPATQRQLNLKLERANTVTRSSTLTLIDTAGLALAASNWRSANSNVGADYGFRPYVKQALTQGKGGFYGIGMTTSVPGYFLSQAIKDDDGRVLGVIVIKIELAAMEREWRRLSDVVLVSDRHDIVFLSNRDVWRYRQLQPLGARERDELLATRQYAQQPLLSTQRYVLDTLEDGSQVIRVAVPAQPAPLLWQRIALPENGWRLHLLHDISGPRAAGHAAALAAGGIWLALALLGLLFQQHQRLAWLRQRSRQELESLLQQHAHELHTAQDGIVQAAQQADTGLSRSLEHLPQGVVIIDTQLRLVAWNSRYLEIFRFPPELICVGRPIEDVFRYNARRGLLGAGPVEAAIQRRLDHLRSGRPHMRESEKEDGTVLEIRGNPLPDGGFVTSYADITSYKNAARELRSLANALENRVAERTRDLAAAKREAENANRYKTRFVAAAVHDLLQPLNAARMFVSALRGKLHDTGARQIVDHVDNALVAQDAILNSLLDISRLESGTLKTQVQDIALDPLLQALTHEFGILAEDRGLRLNYVSSRATVRSDATLLRRILQNFLSNALRYTPSGSVLLGCRRDGANLRIEVHDQGPGIPDALHQEIFEEFRRLGDGVAQDRGAGLGLAIVERIGRLLGHPISLRSQLGRGSVFAVTVPLGDAAAMTQPQAPAAVASDNGDDPILHGCRVWCIDDDPRVCEANSAMLTRWACRVDLAASPKQALAAAQPVHVPELVLLDIHMDEHDGPPLFAQLCARWQAEPRLILVTGEMDTALRALAQQNGWGLLIKPVRAPALRALMTQMLLRRGQSI
ncbi:hybrid sensor histidine kinase/response regulator [Xanthomonas albilineans]|uniref:hybrid sensor histidine kinase/response regulator n=1 Tax=Xanthomonas albilineans TaxID=29447 RepID=UPI0005F34479|nr:PAS-domain containing protein [Xanthomonas albilineans]PPU92168.1 hybrid sensor histidine kinase/response regulator [Xanthomonas albilineans]